LILQLWNRTLTEVLGPNLNLSESADTQCAGPVSQILSLSHSRMSFPIEWDLSTCLVRIARLSGLALLVWHAVEVAGTDGRIIRLGKCRRSTDRDESCEG
jgi:hypothetical protein